MSPRQWVNYAALWLAVAVASAGFMYLALWSLEREAAGAYCGTDTECARLCPPADRECDGGPAPLPFVSPTTQQTYRA